MSEVQMSEVVVLDVLESSGCVFIHSFVFRLCVYTFFWNKNAKGNSRGWYAWKRVDDAGGRGPTCLILSWVRSDWGAPEAPFFLFLSGQGVIEGRRRPDFFLIVFFTFTFSLTHDQPYESMTGSIGQRLLTWLVPYESMTGSIGQRLLT